MSKSKYSPQGPFIIKSARGETWAFDTLMEAAEAIRYSHLDMIDRPFGGGYWLGDTYVPHDRHNFILLDECGLIVPIWRIREALEALPPRKSIYLRFNYDPEKDFRNGPLPVRKGIRCGRFYRRLRTTAEIRAHKGLEADLHDLEEYPVRVKIRGRRKKLPTLWDDIIPSRKGDSWKNYRKTQYKTR
jgi:hypothetical protein